MKTNYDAVVVGGGIAGSSAAAALAKQGKHVLLCEAGLPSDKRLAGELMHPPGAAALDEVGLLEPVLSAGAVPVYGFAIFDGPAEPRAVLSYSEVHGGRPAGIALEHHILARTLFDVVGARPRVTVWCPARVTAADLGGIDPVLTVRRGDKDVVVSAPLVVSAEGRSSPVRGQAGIEVRRGAPFRMVGWAIEGARLPYPGYGHLFTGGDATALAYQVSKDTVRVMFEVGLGTTLPSDSQVAALPEPFRADVVGAMERGAGQTARVYGMTPSRYASGRVAVVGDAGGCVHPLTATGMAFCTADAVRLARALEGDGGLEDALARYEEQRREPMRTRVALGPVLVEALHSKTPAMRLLREGLFRYWERSPRGRGESLGLLSTQYGSMATMAREYAAVCAHAMVGLPPALMSSPVEAAAGAAELLRRSAGHARHALRG